MMTATKTSSLIGLICSRLRAVPPRVPRATRAQKTGGFADGPLEAPFLAQEPGHGAEPAPASTGMASRPLPMKPSANSALAEWPANSASPGSWWHDRGPCRAGAARLLQPWPAVCGKRKGSLAAYRDATLCARGGHDDGEHDEVGECHAGEDVQAAGGLLALGAFRALPLERLCLCVALGFVAHLFEAVSALPEEQVGEMVVPSPATRSAR